MLILYSAKLLLYKCCQQMLERPVTCSPGNIYQIYREMKRNRVTVFIFENLIKLSHH